MIFFFFFRSFQHFVWQHFSYIRVVSNIIYQKMLHIRGLNSIDTFLCWKRSLSVGSVFFYVVAMIFRSKAPPSSFNILTLAFILKNTSCYKMASGAAAISFAFHVAEGKGSKQGEQEKCIFSQINSLLGNPTQY